MFFLPHFKHQNAMLTLPFPCARFECLETLYKKLKLLKSPSKFSIFLMKEVFNRWHKTSWLFSTSWCE
jgi:hypothetical protein